MDRLKTALNNLYERRRPARVILKFTEGTTRKHNGNIRGQTEATVREIRGQDKKNHSVF